MGEDIDEDVIAAWHHGAVIAASAVCARADGCGLPRALDARHAPRRASRVLTGSAVIAAPRTGESGSGDVSGHRHDGCG